jgi:hypothetical protein
LIVTSYYQPQTSPEYLITGTKVPVKNLTHDSIGLIILTISWLTTKYKNLLILPQLTSLEVIDILQTGETPALITTNMTTSTLINFIEVSDITHVITKVMGQS